MTQPGILKFGIPKGSLQDATINLFAKSGWKIRQLSPQLFSRHQ